MTFLKKYGSEILEAVLIFLALFIFFYPAQVEGNSMEDTLSHGDIIMMSRAMAFAGIYDKGDIVVFEYENGKKEINVIKRIAAVEGDKVEAENGLLYINGEEQEGYLCKNDFSFTIDEGYVFVLGDNPDESTDSREFGEILKEDIKARAIIKLWPVTEIKSIF